MKSAGWDYWPTEDAWIGVGETPNTVEALAAYRKNFGYGYASAASVFEENPNVAFRATLSESALSEYLSSLYGPGGEEFVYKRGEEAGCLNVARAELMNAGFHILDGELVYSISESYFQVLATDEYVDAVTAWRECMKAAGYPEAVDPDQMFDLFRASTSDMALAEKRAFELQLAAAEWPCYLNNVVPVARELETALIQELVENADVPPPVSIARSG